MGPHAAHDDGRGGVGEGCFCWWCVVGGVQSYSPILLSSVPVLVVSLCRCIGRYVLGRKYDLGLVCMLKMTMTMMMNDDDNKAARPQCQAS